MEALHALRQEKEPDPAEQVESPEGVGAPVAVPVQRAIPRWYPWAVGCFVIALCAILATQWPSGSGESTGPISSAARGEVEEALSQEVRIQSNGVVWTLRSLLVTDQSASLAYTVEGPRGVYLLRGSAHVEMAGAALPLWDERVRQRPNGLEGTAMFPIYERPTGALISLPPLFRSQGERAVVQLDADDAAEHQHGLTFRVLYAGESDGRYTVRVAVEGEGDWLVAPELGVFLSDAGYSEGALTSEREHGGSVLRLTFPLPPAESSPNTLQVPLAEKVRGSWQAWILIS